MGSRVSVGVQAGTSKPKNKPQALCPKCVFGGDPLPPKRGRDLRSPYGALRSGPRGDRIESATRKANWHRNPWKITGVFFRTRISTRAGRSSAKPPSARHRRICARHWLLTAPDLGRWRAKHPPNSPAHPSKSPLGCARPTSRCYVEHTLSGFIRVRSSNTDFAGRLRPNSARARPELGPGLVGRCSAGLKPMFGATGAPSPS